MLITKHSALALGLLLLIVVSGANVQAQPASGALAIHPTSPYYFQDASGNPIWLIANYTNCFSDYGYDYITYFNTMQSKGLNFCRVWVCKGRECLPDGSVVFYLAFQRPGPGTAEDGKPKADLTKYSSSFFSRLRSVCQAAKDRGIFMQLIFLDAWNIKRSDRFIVNVYNVKNNINGVDADVNKDGDAIDSGEFCSTSNTGVYNTQKAFIAKVIEETNQYDNIFYEIANENYYSASWELALADYTEQYESSKPKQHLVMPKRLPNHDYGGIKTWNISNLRSALLNARSLQQPLIWDTDGIGSVDDTSTRKAMYTVYVSGGHAGFDDGDSFGSDPTGSSRTTLRNQMLYLKNFAYSAKFWQMTPSNSLVASGTAYAMASNKELVAYLPSGGNVTFNLTTIPGTLSYRWYNTRSGSWGTTYQIEGGANRSLSAPDSNDWAIRIWGPDDAQAPSVPTDVNANALSQTSIQVTWTASTDNVGVTGYKIYRNGILAGTSATTSYTDSGLTAGTTYSYTVSAYDAAANNSAQSSPPAVATTLPPDTTPPSVPEDVQAAVLSHTSIQVTWTASTDNIGVTGYKIYRNGSLAGTSSTTSYTSTGLIPGTTYSYTVSAYDAAGNDSAQSSPPAVASTPADNDPPSVPTNVTAVAQSETSIQVTWTASTDNVGVIGYKVFRNGSQVGTPTSATYTDTGLTPDTTYSYTVSAHDAAGNNSAQSSPPAVASTPPAPSSISPNDDTFTHSRETGTAHDNQGIFVKQDYQRHGWIEFTVGSIAVAQAKLRMYQTLTTCDDQTIELRAAEYNFNEGTLTWNNQPNADGWTLLGSWNSPSGARWYELDITSFYNSKLGKTVTIRLKTTWQSLDYYGQIFEDRENSMGTGNLPYVNLLLDGQAPSIPANVTATALSSSAIRVDWIASTDNIGVIGYRISRNDVQVGTSSTTSYTDSGLAPGTTCSYTVSAYDLAGNTSAQSSPPAVATTLTTTDEEPPSVPTNVGATAQSTSSILVTWTASTDNVGVAGYTVFRNGSSVGTSPSPSYTDSGLQAGTTYSYTVSAYDGDGNYSAQSPLPAVAKTPGGSGTISANDDTFTTPHDSNTHDNEGILVKYWKDRWGWYEFTTGSLAVSQATLRIYQTYSGCDQQNIELRGGQYNFDETTFKWSNQPNADGWTYLGAWNMPDGSLRWYEQDITSFYNNNLGKTITIRLKPTWQSRDYYCPVFEDRENTKGTGNTPRIVYTGFIDSQAPSVPSNVQATSSSPTTANISWSASTDNVGVAGYRVYRNSTHFATVTTTSCADSGLIPGTSYSYTVSAFDAAGNNSAQSSPPAEITPADTAPPSVPTNITAVPLTPTLIRLTWTASTDDVGVAGYRVFQDGGPSGICYETSYTDTNVAPNSTYSYTVTAFDGADNESEESSPVVTATSYPALEIAAAKLLPDTSPVGFLSRTVSAVLGDCIYIQEADRHAGIKVVAAELPAGLAVGDSVDVGGIIQSTLSGERYVLGNIVLVY